MTPNDPDPDTRLVRRPLPKRVLTVRVPPSVVGRIDAAAARRKISRSAWIVRLIDRGLAGEEKSA